MKIQSLYDILDTINRFSIEKKSLWIYKDRISYIFSIVTDMKYLDIYHIYPLKQTLTAQIYKVEKKYKSIKHILICGNAIPSHCHIDTDLNICIDLNPLDGIEIYRIQNKIGILCD